MDARQFKPRIILTIEAHANGHETSIGSEVVSLCKGVKETGSLNAAAKNIQMGYSKAWRLMKEAEEAFGTQLLIRDGAHGSTLTKEADNFIAAYDKLKKHLEDEADRSFADFLD